MNAATATYDSRGLVLTQTRPDGASVTFRYDARGTLTSYTDEVGEETRFDTDALGRVTTIHYPDGTTEETRYENVTGAVSATKDRAGLWLSYQYDSGGRVSTVHLGEVAEASPVAVRYTYDGAGRLQRVANADAAIEFGEYDHLGNPGVTRSIRYQFQSGVGEAPVKRDVHTQGHVWSVFGERTRWRMPAAGDELPDTEAGPDESLSWLTWIEEERDGAGNARTRRQASAKSGEATGHLLTDTTWRGAGRPKSRKIFGTSGTGLLTSFFEYADGTGDVSGPKSGLLGEMSTQTADAIVIAGSLSLRDGAMRIAGAKDLGLQRRGSLWSYDARGRLASAKILTLAGTEVPQPATIDTISAADFRSQRHARPGRLTDPQRETLGLAALEVEPPTRGFAEITGHRIESITESLGEIAAPARSFTWAGGRRTSDGRRTTTYDAFGRAVRVEDAERRITYTYNPNNRVVGRLAERAFGSTWATEDRGDILTQDGLPADTTWVWDPITDRLVAIYEAGKSAAATSPQAGLLRQFLHGDAAYDDPVLAKIALFAGAPPTTYYPVTDHAATGSMHAVVGEDGTLVERVLYADPYGDAPRYLTGAVADHMSVEIEKDGDGNIAEVRVRVRFSEAVKESSLTGGLRLATMTLSGSVAAETTVEPVLEEGSTSSVIWTIPAAEWLRLTDRSDADALEIAAGTGLRFEGWGQTPIAAPPDWARTIYGLGSTAEWPVSKRYRLTTLATEAGSIAASEKKTIPVFDLGDLYLFANTRSATKLLTGFHAASFVEPATGYVYMRARWMDPATGNFLTSDPSLYTDSSNLHAAFAWDPINNRDPRGTNVIDTHFALDMGVLADARQGIGNTLGSIVENVPVMQRPEFWGVLQVVGGTAEVGLGAGAVATPTGVGQLVGGLAIAHGLDTAWTGVKQIWTGERQRTITSRQIEGAASFYGASAERAEMIGEWSDATIGISLTLGAGGIAKTDTVLRRSGLSWRERREVYKALDDAGFGYGDRTRLIRGAKSVVPIRRAAPLVGPDTVALTPFSGRNFNFSDGYRAKDIAEAFATDYVEAQAKMLKARILREPQFADLAEVIPELNRADEVIVFVKPDMVGVNLRTMAEIEYVLSTPSVLKKTTFFTGFHGR
jgi:RHS repeat-associated protein